MMRFRCPTCDKSLKVPDTFAGRKFTCPRCNELAVVPVAPPPEPPAEPSDRNPGLFATMSTRLRLIVALLATAGGLGLFTTVVPSVLGGEAWVGHAAMVGTAACVLSLLVIIHGHGQGCPHCGKWWSRRMVRSEVGDRDVFDRGGTTYGRSTTRTEFKCPACGHGWSVTDSEEYRVSERTHKLKTQR
jgi:predicted RNA-binding Zn-ribbon protein involved in translation (DUF1610 family)